MTLNDAADRAKDFTSSSPSCGGVAASLAGAWSVGVGRPRRYIVSPDGRFMFVWMTVLTGAVLYNLWTCIAREAFSELTAGVESLWFAADALADLVYVVDIVVQTRTGYWHRTASWPRNNILKVLRYKKLSYRRVTARCVLSVVILPITTQVCRNYLYDKS